ncbi:phage tail protein [Marivita geojedonensis]|uniref:phage tail protein n=1 Tax=Marivita geojedonensis TaxID=1123756 RepID=UPI000D0691FA
MPPLTELTGLTSMRRGLRSGADLIASASVAEKDAFLSSLEEVDGALLALRYLFEFWAHPHQLPPEGDWRSWVILGGRGAGKTRAGAEWVRQVVEGSRPKDAGRARRLALVGETLDQVREVMIFGDSGIMACSPPDRRPEWLATRRMLRWPNGAEAVACSAHDPESLRGPQFDGAWVDEIGCAAVNKATNEPNKFLDPKSSESTLPAYANGLRDELIQHQYLRAMLSYWGDPANNPVSGVTGEPMIDMGRVFVWAWDARPYPWFPNTDEMWSDGPNYRRGHWINGRVSGRTLASVVSEICERSGLHDYDVSALYGFVRGYLAPNVSDARRALQPLMMAYGFDAIERDGVLVFRNRNGAQAVSLADDQLAAHVDLGADVVQSRSSEAEMSGRVRLNFVEADGDYRNIAEESALPDESTHAVAESEVPLLLTRPEGRQAVERWLSEARVSRDAVRFALPLSQQALGAGDVVRLPAEAGDMTVRIDRVEQTTHQLIDAVRIEPEVYHPADFPDDPTPSQRYVASGPVLPLFLDLPLITGDEVPHAPHLAVTADPWPGDVAVYDAAEDAGYSLNGLVAVASTVGVTVDPVARGPSGLLDHATQIDVTLTSGSLSSVSEAGLLGGANLAALGTGEPGAWEVIQFQTAQLIAPDVWRLSNLLRGQYGTDALVSDVLGAGAYFVLLDGSPRQIALAAAQRGQDRHYRIGPADKPVDHAVYRHEVHAFEGVGLRPYSPVHLSASMGGADLSISWIRRGRIDADGWDLPDIPLGEDREAYVLRVLAGGVPVRTVELSAAEWIYTAAMQSEDAVAGQIEVEVAQLSDRFGPGPAARIAVSL